VLLVQAGDVPVELVDSLTEWLIAKLASRGGYEMVGKEAFRAQIGKEEKRVFACVSNRTCLSNVATALALDRIIVGTLGVKDKGKPSKRFIYQLYLINAVTAKEIKRVNGEVKGGPEKLAEALDPALTELLKPPVQPGGLIVKANINGAKVHLDDRFVGSAPAAVDKIQPKTYRLRVVQSGYYTHEQRVEVEPGRVRTIEVELIEKQEPRRSWLFYTAWSTAGVAAAVGIAAAVVGGLSQKQPTGPTQVAAVDDLRRRESMALSANVLIGVGSAVALASAAVFVFGWDRFTVRPENAGAGAPTGADEGGETSGSFGSQPQDGRSAWTGGVTW
jgi:hypothetical protein